jgi:hypothetical protein
MRGVPMAVIARQLGHADTREALRASCAQLCRRHDTGEFSAPIARQRHSYRVSREKIRSSRQAERLKIHYSLDHLVHTKSYF